MKRPKLIGVEGTDGVGKTTLIREKEEFQRIINNLFDISCSDYLPLKLKREEIPMDSGYEYFFNLFHKRSLELNRLHQQIESYDVDCIVLDRIGFQALYMGILELSDYKPQSVEEILKAYIKSTNHSLKEDLSSMIRSVDYIIVVFYVGGKEQLKEILKNDEEFIKRHPHFNWKRFELLYELYESTKKLFSEFGISEDDLSKIRYFSFKRNL